MCTNFIPSELLTLMVVLKEIKNAYSKVGDTVQKDSSFHLHLVSDQFCKLDVVSAM